MDLAWTLFAGTCLFYLWVKLVRLAVEVDKRDSFVRFMRRQFH